MVTCRHCGSPLGDPVLDLSHQPPSNAYLTSEDLLSAESTFPLQLYVCQACWLVQLPAYTTADQLFTEDYAYLSSTSSSWCSHAKKFVNSSIKRLNLDSSNFVLEVASNDGYLLQYVKSAGIPCLGVEPTKIAGSIAQDRGIPTICEFLTEDFAHQLVSDKKLMPKLADLIIGNNVLAHVPDINNFVSSLSILLAPQGSISLEFPHLMELINHNQFDTIYHEHYSYLSLGFVRRIAERFNLEVYDVEQLNTHGGSLRVWLGHSGKHPVMPSVPKYKVDPPF